MKSCPACNRIYTDDTYTFCLDDGALLATSLDHYATVQMPNDERTVPAKTEALPPAAAFETQPAQAMAAVQGHRTLVLPAEAAQSHQAEKSNGKTWLILSGVIAFAIAGLVIALGYTAWRADDQTATKPSNDNSTASTNGNVTANTNGDTSEEKVSDDNNLQWLNGVWEGEAYQVNPKSTWTIRLKVQNDKYVIEYPSLSCQGKWTLTGKESGKARFKESITRGLDRCENNGTVLIEKINDTQISFEYSSPNTTSITSAAVLRKRVQSTE